MRGVDRGALPAFDLTTIPFSRPGSWTNLSFVVGEGDVRPDVHLVSHTTARHAVLALVPWTGGARASTEIHADPARVQWRSGESRTVTAAYEGDDVLRVAGIGVGLRLCAADPTLTPFAGTYLAADPASGSHVFTSYETGRRYRVTVLAGTARVVGCDAVGTAERAVEVDADDGGPWEIAVEELSTSRAPYAAGATFEEVVDAAGRQFLAYADQVATWRPPEAPTVLLAVYLLWSATVRPAGLVRRPAVLMSMHWMDKVWSWDHCFNALALAPGDPDLAWHQIRLPFDHQDDSGALPDSVTHSEVLHNFVKPPVHGWALGLLLDRLPLVPPREELGAVYDDLARWTGFWRTARTAPGRDLPYYQHGNDSGWDNATVFAREQLVEAPDLAAFLILQLGTLADLARRLDRPDEAERWAQDRAALCDHLLETLWDDDAFVVHGVASGRDRSTSSLLTVLPLVAADHLPREVVDSLVRGARAHLTEHGLATERVTSTAYEPDGYWRGPIWAPSTVLVVDGLRRAGEHALAETIVGRFLALCERSGFAENFDALTGAGLRDRAYTWTASAYLLFAEHRARSHHEDSRHPGPFERTAGGGVEGHRMQHPHPERTP